MVRLFSRHKQTKAPAVDLSRVQTSSVKVPIDRVMDRPARTKRQFARTDAWAVCQVILESGAVKEGVLLDFSEGGARVRFRSRSTLPSRMQIKALRHGLNRKAELVWQDVFDVGLRFVDDFK